jgi:hypothetical protein
MSSVRLGILYSLSGMMALGEIPVKDAVLMVLPRRNVVCRTPKPFISSLNSYFSFAFAFYPSPLPLSLSQAYVSTIK